MPLLAVMAGSGMLDCQAEPPSALIPAHGSISWHPDSNLYLTVPDSMRMASVPQGLPSGSRFSALGLASLGGAARCPGSAPHA